MKVTVSWSGVANASTNDWISPSTHDWIGLYHVGDGDTAGIDWVYDSSCTRTAGRTAKSSGSCSFAMPLAFGNYEFRLLANEGESVLATSNIVTAG